MDYYDVFDQNYIRLAKNERKIPVTKIILLNYYEYEIEDLTSDIIAGSESISTSYEQGVQSKLSFDICYNEKHKYNCDEDNPFWLEKKLKVYIGLYNSDTGDTYYFSKGIFVVTGMVKNDKIISVSAVDKFGLFTSDTGFALLENDTHIDLGDTIWDMFTDILSQDKGNGKPLDPQPPLIDFETRHIELGEDIELSTGSYIGDLFVDIANNLRCRIYYNTKGKLVVRSGGTDFHFDKKAPIWEFDEKVSSEYLSSSFDYDFSSVKNRITVWGEDFDGVSYVSTKMNTNPKSPVCVDKVGYRVADTIEDMYGYNQGNVDAFAEVFLQMKSIIGLSVKVECAYLPHLNVEDVVVIKDPSAKELEFRLLISEINISDNKMSLGLTNIDHLPHCSEFSK